MAVDADVALNTDSAAVVPAAVDGGVVVANPAGAMPAGNSPKRVWGPAQEWPALPDTKPRAPTAAVVTDPAETAPADATVTTTGDHPYVFQDIRADNAAQLQDFGRAMHATGASQEAVSAALGFARSLAAKESARIEAADNQHAAAMKTELSQLWGNDYQPTDRAISAFLDRLPPRVEDMIVNARDENGTKFLNTAEGLTWLANWNHD